MHGSHTMSVVVPAYNEMGNLEGAVRDAVHALRTFDDYEVIIVNDGSQDGTGEVADRNAEHSAPYPRGRVGGLAFDGLVEEPAPLEQTTFLDRAHPQHRAAAGQDEGSGRPGGDSCHARKPS